MQASATPETTRTDRNAVTVRQAASRLSCSTRSIYRLLGEGHLRIVKLGRATRVCALSIDRFIEAGGAS